VAARIHPRAGLEFRQHVGLEAGLTAAVVAPGWRTQLLAIITDPNIALKYGLIFEFLSPGAVAPGLIGAVSRRAIRRHCRCQTVCGDPGKDS
jgi:hypothetical protein